MTENVESTATNGGIAPHTQSEETYRAAIAAMWDVLRSFALAR